MQAVFISMEQLLLKKLYFIIEKYGILWYNNKKLVDKKVCQYETQDNCYVCYRL